MNEQKRDIMVGLFVLIGLIALGAMIVAFGEAPQWFGRRGYEVRLKFSDKLSDVQEGTSVTMGGIPIGRVSRLEFIQPGHPEQGTWVVATIEQPYTIPRPSIGRVRPAAIGFGRSDILIEVPATMLGTVPTDGSGEIDGTMGSPLDSVFPEKVVSTLTATADQIRELAKELTPVASDLHEILKLRPVDAVETATSQGRKIPPNMYTAVDRLYRVLTHFDTVLGDPNVQSNVKVALQNFRDFSEQAKVAAADLRAFTARGQSFGDKFEQTMDTTREQLTTLSQKLARNSDQLAEVLDNVSKATKDISEGEGTMGKFLRDPKLYDEMLLTVQRLSQAIGELQGLIQKLDQKGLFAK